jgi:hypothetical protein
MQVNYTDQANAAFRRSQRQLLQTEGVATDLHGRILCFLGQSRYYFFQIAPQLYSQGCVDTVPDPRPLRKSGSAQESNPGPLDLWPETLTTRPQRRSK